MKLPKTVEYQPVTDFERQTSYCPLPHVIFMVIMASIGTQASNTGSTRAGWCSAIRSAGYRPVTAAKLRFRP
jgi:hypothetical protein